MVQKQISKLVLSVRVFSAETPAPFIFSSVHKQLNIVTQQTSETQVVCAKSTITKSALSAVCETKLCKLFCRHCCTVGV